MFGGFGTQLIGSCGSCSVTEIRLLNLGAVGVMCFRSQVMFFTDGCLHSYMILALP